MLNRVNAEIHVLYHLNYSLQNISEQKALIEKQQEKEKKMLQDFREMVIS